MGAFSGIKNAKVKSNLYLEEGEHHLKILCCKQKKGWDDKVSFIVEFDVLESTKYPRGARPAWVIKLRLEDTPMSKKILELQYADIKQFISVLSGKPSTSIEENDVEEVTSADNPLEGLEIKAISKNQSTKAGGTFTKHMWLPAA